MAPAADAGVRAVASGEAEVLGCKRE